MNQRRYGSWWMALYRRKLHFLLLMKSRDLPAPPPSSHRPPPDNFAPPPWALTPHQQSRLCFFSCSPLIGVLVLMTRVILTTSPSRESRQLAGGTGAVQRQVSCFSFGGGDPNRTDGGVLQHNKMRQKERCKVVLGPNKVAERVKQWIDNTNGMESTAEKPTHFTAAAAF